MRVKGRYDFSMIRSYREVVMVRTFLLLAVFSTLALCATALSAQSLGGSETPAYKDPRLPVERRVEDLLGGMTPAEKARMLAGSGWMESSPIARLGIPAIKMADGPMGVRNWAASSRDIRLRGAFSLID
jgi:hypothetical protein